ncbi:MAG: hypothetical protein JWQ21_70 [Herminiimonas sp.]|nr:hypothetical protein [Herminiimonas sp.]
MLNDIQRSTRSSAGQRKEMLVTQGAIYRFRLGESRDVVQANLHADVLVGNTIDHVATAASAAFQNIFRLKNFQAAHLQLLLPLLTQGVSLLSKKSLRKPVIRGALMLGVAGAAAFFIYRNRQAVRHRNDQQSNSGE